MRTKNIKKVAAVTVSCGMLASSLSGCALLEKNMTIEEILQEASSYNTYSVMFNANASNKASNEDLSLSVLGYADNMNVSLASISLNSNIDDEKVDLEISDAFRMIDGKLYVNVSSLVKVLNSDAMKDMSGDTLDSILEESGLDIDLDSIGWLELPVAEYNETANEKMSSIQNTFISNISEALKTSEIKVDRIEKNNYKISISDRDSLVKLLTTIKDTIKNNKDTYINQASDIIKSVEYEALIDTYGDIIIDTVKETCSAIDLSYTDDDLSALSSYIDEAIKASDIQSAVDEQIDDMSDYFDESIESIESMIDDITNSDTDNFILDYEIALTGKKNNHVVSQKITFNTKETDEDTNAEEDVSIIVSAEIAQLPESMVSVPENANDIPSVVSGLVKNILPDEIKESIKEVSLSDLLSSLTGTSSTGIENSYDDSAYNEFDDYNQTTSDDYISNNENSISSYDTLNQDSYEENDDNNINFDTNDYSLTDEYYSDESNNIDNSESSDEFSSGLSFFD